MKLRLEARSKVRIQRHCVKNRAERTNASRPLRGVERSPVRSIPRMSAGRTHIHCLENKHDAVAGNSGKVESCMMASAPSFSALMLRPAWIAKMPLTLQRTPLRLLSCGVRWSDKHTFPKPAALPL